jgi:HK97 family phage major capsid protein/HK97 family phage prohead protease
VSEVRRALTLWAIKSVDADKRVIEGIATTPTPDRVGDIVEPLGVKFKNPLPLLLFHDSQLPVGEVKFGKATPKGIPFTASIPDVTEPGRLKERVDEAWQSVKYGLIKGVSIGFRVLTDGMEVMRSGGMRFTATEVMELSLVPIPANSEAMIHGFKSIEGNTDALINAFKSFDVPYLAPRGTGSVRVSSVIIPAVAGGANVTARKGAASMAKKTYADQIHDLENTRAAKSARMEEIQTKASDESRTKDEAEREEFDTIREDLKGIDAELVDLRELEKSVVVKATPVAPAAVMTQEAASQARSGHVITVKQTLPAGLGIARAVMAQIQARKEYKPIEQIVKSRWPSDTRLHAYVTKASVPAGTTTDATWASPLSDQTNLASEFIEFLRPKTIVGRIPGLTNVPFNIRVTGQSTGAVANWVGQGRSKPVTSFSTFATTLLRTKIAAIAVITEELALDSSPSAETLVRNELARAVIERMDIDFVDPAQAASSGVNPASITNGVTALTPSGTTEAAARLDLTTLLSQFVENNVDPSSLVLVMPNSLALALSLMVNSLGQASFPGLSAQGGTLLGIPVVASQYAANASGAGNLVIAINAPDIFLADDGQVTLDASREASIEMSDAPAGRSDVPTGHTSTVSMYQTNSIAVRAERYINWAKVRSTAVVYMDDVNWGSVGSPS